MATLTAPVVESAEVAKAPSWHAQHGLGYGIDITNTQPWRNKGPLIVRPVRDESDVQMREEERALEEYEREIVSGKDISLSVGMTLSSSESLVMMGVDADIARSTTHLQYAVGRKIHTRTYDFTPKSSGETTEFESRLKSYTAECTTRKELRRRCKDFIKEYRCTHYIRAIRFGAAEYRVLAAEYYNRVRSIGGKVGFATPNGAPSIKERLRYLSYRRDINSDQYKIGSWKESSGKMEVEDHVIEWEIRSIDTLIEKLELKEELQAALEEYRKEALQKKPIGPFYIRCGTKENPVYLCKTAGNRVTVTTESSKATMFSLCLDDINDPTQFSIQLFCDEESPARLSSKHFFGGISPSNDPPTLSKTKKGVNVHFSLKDPFKSNKQVKPLPMEWIETGNWYAIYCNHKKGLKVSSKFCVILKGTFKEGLESPSKPSRFKEDAKSKENLKLSAVMTQSKDRSKEEVRSTKLSAVQSSSKDKEDRHTKEFELSAVSSIQMHDEEKQSYMLFSLQSVPIDMFEHKPKKKDLRATNNSQHHISCWNAYEEGEQFHHLLYY